MQASAPSRMALATSVASARVGRGVACMLSSICVATITGFCILPGTRATIRFCTMGILATSISTPRSPRATITRVGGGDDRFELVQGLLLFDLGDNLGLRAAAGEELLKPRTSAGVRTKLRLTKSMAASAAQAAFFQSSSLMAATLSLARRAG